MVLIATLFAFHQLFTPANSAPTSTWHPPHGNKTALQHEIAPSWVAEPKERGTMSLLYSCTFTMFLCVYTAVHLNVPPQGEKKRYFYLRKAKWVLVALLAPEVVLYTAWSQWRDARWLRYGRSDLSLSAKKRLIQFGLMQCFYVAMGGVVVDFSAVEDQECKEFLSEKGLGSMWTLTTNGFHESRITDLPCKSISDKSKADVLAKGLTISRKIEGLPLTVLEIHTLVHVVCALFMYVLWFEKPVDVRDPTVIKVEDAIKAWDSIKASLGPNFAPSLIPYAPNLDYNVYGKKKQQAILLVALCAAYGGVHLAAWNFEFPTNAEKLIWRITCIITMVGTAVSWYILYLYTIYVVHLRDQSRGLLEMLGESNHRRKIAMIVTAIVSLFFILARIVITIMSFISLRKVPAGVYATVQWNDLIPHF
uniref:Uncharacterized protein n=1 Tax=Pyronema omphalodes (strain CBS 100304) TaxID=1076935 RepID=U4LQ61_PYROM